MICGIGTDIAKVSRFKKWIDNPEMINHFFNEKEVKESGCESALCQHYAARFAAKEAIYKAVSSLLKERFSISWQNAQVINDENGNPKVEFIDIEFPEIQNIDISISHCREYAVATVVITLYN